MSDNKRIVLYYVSSKNGLDGKDSYEFWFNGSVIRIIADKPFSRGDVAELISVDTKGKIFNVRIIDETEEEFQKYPILAFAVSRIYFNEYSNFEVIRNSDSVELLGLFSSVKDRNLSVAAAVLLEEGQGEMDIICSRFNTQFTFSFNTEFKPRR